MNYFLDTEFHEDGKVLDLISIGMVSEDGRTLYAESSDVNLDLVNPWVKKNVVPRLRGASHCHRPGGRAVADITLPETKIRNWVQEFIGKDKAPVIWAYYADYDWVLFCQLFGAMVNLPKNFPMLCMDLQQWWIHLGCPEEMKPPKPTDAHHALADARWNEEFFKNMDKVWRWEG